MTTSKSIIERLKTENILQYSAISVVNDSAKRLSDLIRTSIGNISKHTNAIKSVINIASDQEVSSGPKKIDLSKIPVHLSDGLFIEDGRVKQIPVLSKVVSPTSVLVHGNGDSFITVDESGEKLEKPKLFFAEDIKNGLEFQYQDKGLLVLVLEFSFERDSRISVIAIDTGDTYSGKQTEVNSVFLNDSRTVKFNTIKNNNIVYILLDEEVEASVMSVKLTSNAYVSQEDISLLRIRSMKFGTVGYKNSSRLILGPIGSNTLKIVKAGISTGVQVNGIKFSLSTNASNWIPFDTENEKGYSLSLDTIFQTSKGINTNKIFILIEVENTVSNSIIEKIVFEKYAGEDCFDTTLLFGGSSITSMIIQDYVQSVFDTVSEKYIYPSDIEPLKNYRTSMIPYNPVAPSKVFEERYNSRVVINPNTARFYVYGAIVNTQGANKQYSHFVYKRKDNYIPGRYSYIINGENKKSFDIYGEYDFSLSRFILRVNKTDTIQVLIENEEETKRVAKEELVSIAISDTEEYISMAPIFTFEDISYSPAYFYPYRYESHESITENGSNIQNGLFMLPFVRLDYPKGRTSDIRIRDLDTYDGFLKLNTQYIDRTKIYRSKHKKIRNIEINGNKHLSRVQFINGDIEFLEKKKYSAQAQVVNSEIILNGIKPVNDVEVYTSGYARKLIRVYRAEDIVSDFNFMVTLGKIQLHHNMNNETINIVYQSDTTGQKIGNMYSVNYEDGVVYFSSYQDQIVITYEYLDSAIFSDMLTDKSIAQEGLLESIGISTIQEEVEMYQINVIPTINIGVIYE